MKKIAWGLGGLVAVLLIATFVFSGTVTKGTLGKQDIRLWYSGTSAQTFDRTTSQGYTMTLNPLDWVGIDVHQVYGGGVNRTNTVLASAASDVGYSTKRQMFLNPGTWSITADMNVGDYTDLYWNFAPGATLNVDTGITATFPRPENILGTPKFSGAGTVAFSTKGWAYSEWWGIDGTSDDVQINAALTAAGKVKLLAKTYDCRLVITPPSNSVLEGSGNDTVLDGANVAGANKIAIGINGVTNVTLRNFYMDCQSGNHAGVVNNNGQGIQIYGGSTKILLENIYVYDADYMGVHVRTSAEDVTLSNVTVDTGCYSSSLLIGTFLTETGNVRNIQVNNFKSLNSYGHGIGIWNAGTGVTENINLNNTVIKNYGTTAPADGYGIWGSTDAKNVNISNFVIDSAATCSGNGLHLEAIDSWTFTNGEIANIVVGYGINATGAVKRSNFSNITIRDCAVRGILVNDVAVDNNFSNIVISGSVEGGRIGGVRNSFTDLKVVGDFGAAGNGLHITYHAENLVLSNYQIHNTGTGTTGAGLYFDTDEIVSATVKNGRITGTITTPVKGNTGKVKGETASVKIRSVVAAGTAYEVMVLALPATQNYYIASLHLGFSAAIVQDDTDYNTYTVRKYDGAGGAQVGVITAKTTKTTGGSNFAALTPIELVIASHANANVAGGYNISLKKAVGGAGKAEADGLLTINYITY